MVYSILPFDIVYFGLKIPLLNFEPFNDWRPYFQQNKMREFLKCYPNGKSNSIRIIIYGLRTYAVNHLAVFEKVLSDALRYNGANVQNLICDSFLSSCDGATVGQSDKKICRMCSHERAYFMKIYANDFLFFSQFINNDEQRSIREKVALLDVDNLIDYTFLGVNVGNHALNSCKKYFKYGIFDSEDERHLKVIRHNLFQGMLMVQIANNLLVKESPTHFITLHGGYSTWGPIAEYFHNKGVAVYRYEKSVNNMGYFYITRFREDLSDIVARDLWEVSKNKDLSKDQRDVLRKLFQDKKCGISEEYKQYNAAKRNYFDEKLNELLNSKDRKKFALYPHVIWDKGYLDSYDSMGSFFKDDVEWMIETIKFFINRDDRILFIKPHPGERLSEDFTSHGAEKIIMDYFGSLPENVMIIKGDYPITSFDLMDKDCIGIAFSSTVGLEYSYFRKPVIVAANIHYKFAGAVHTIKTREEYFSLIESPEPLYYFLENNYHIIERYAYYYYFGQQVRIPFFRDDMYFIGHPIDWNVLKNYEEFIANDKNIKHVAQSIIDKKSVVSSEVATI
jgi:hypothetical protein